MSEPMDTLDKEWRSACKLVLGADAGPLSGYESWLSLHLAPLLQKKSSLSSKPVTFYTPHYTGSAFIAFDEIDFNKAYPPFDTAKIRSTADIINLLPGRLYYAGNIILGHSSHCEKSSAISNCHYLSEVKNFNESKYAFKCGFGRYNESVFGVYGPGESAYCITCSQLVRTKRSLEAWDCTNCSDCYYSYGLDNCSDCLFCFHLKSKRHCVGNIQLTPAKYGQIKARLQKEMLAALKVKGRLPTLMDIIGRCRLEPPKIEHDLEDENSSQLPDLSVIEREFSQACKVVLGRELKDLDSYGPWLSSFVRSIRVEKSAISGKKLLFCQPVIADIPLPPDRLVGMKEAELIGQSVSARPDAVADISLQNAHLKIFPMAFVKGDFWEGANSNIIECVVPVSSSDMYRSTGIVHSKRCAFSFWPVESVGAFGCDSVFQSSFCLHCYNSARLTRCFECDSCRDCSDCYFSHNIEGCTDCLFCFNVKSRRYAVTNVEVGKEEYLRIKKLVLSEIVSKLEKDKNLELSIFNLGGQKK